MVTNLIERRKMRTWRLKLVGHPGSVSLARACVKELLEGWGYSDPGFQADAALITSELVTNSLLALDVLDDIPRKRYPLHRRHLIRVQVRELGRSVHIGVWDSAPHTPEIAAMPSADAPGGRGLPIVSELAVESGVRRVKDSTVGGKIVYATLKCP